MVGDLFGEALAFFGDLGLVESWEGGERPSETNGMWPEMAIGDIIVLWSASEERERVKTIVTLTNRTIASYGVWTHTAYTAHTQHIRRIKDGDKASNSISLLIRGSGEWKGLLK